jgi:hypothetical protein
VKDYTFNFEIVTLITQFADAFNDVVVKRYNNDRETNGQEIGVTFIYAPKQRIIYDLTNKQNNIKLPIVSYNITSFARDTSRVFNKLQGAEITGSLKFDRIRQPVPVNLGISLNILTKFQLDMDQIISNFVPYCDPYVVVSWPDPYAGQEIRTIIEWDGNVGINYPIDQSATTPFSRVEGTANFTIKGWIFKNQQASIGKIHNIYANFFSVKDIYCSYTAMQQATSDLATDFMVISGRPQFTGVTPNTLTSGVPRAVTVTGRMFEKTDLFFLTGSLLNQTVYDLTTSPFISSYANYITGVQIVPIAKSDTSLTFIIDTPIEAGFIDVVGINDAGLGRLSTDTFRTITCPYALSGDCVNWPDEIYQPPSISGIKIL